MEKLSIEKFREYCKFTQELYELLRDESKMEAMPPEEVEKLEEKMEQMNETLKNSDLSGIPFEEWENFVLVIQDLNLENTGANIDFNLITIPPEMSGYKIDVNLRGCNVRNFNFDKNMFRYTSESFDPEFVEEAIAQSKSDTDSKEKKKKGFFKKNKKIDDIIEVDDDITYNNQILNWKK